jgi:hypothetical protein
VTARFRPIAVGYECRLGRPACQYFVAMRSEIDIRSAGIARRELNGEVKIINARLNESMIANARMQGNLEASRRRSGKVLDASSEIKKVEPIARRDRIIQDIDRVGEV